MVEGLTLSGGGKTRILYMNTCDPDQHWTTSHCQNQDHPRLTVQNLTFSDGNAVNISNENELGRWSYLAREAGSKLSIAVFNNHCAYTGPDVGGAAVRVFSQYNGLPAHVVNSTFEGLGIRNVVQTAGE